MPIIGTWCYWVYDFDRIAAQFHRLLKPEGVFLIGDVVPLSFWSSIDQPVQDGLKKALEAKIKAGGDDITIKFTQTGEIVVRVGAALTAP